MTLPPAITHIHVEAVQSTNDVARTQALAGAAHLTLVTADLQKQGRGRGERTWISPHGNLYSSLILRPGPNWPDITTLPHVAALAIYDCVASLLPEGRNGRLKWPNDVLVGGRKISGVLIEGEGIGIKAQRGGRCERTSADFMIIGVGINVTKSPDTLGGQKATNLVEEGAVLPQGRECPEVCASLMRAMLGRIDMWIGGGFGAIKQAYLNASVPIGTPISIRVARSGDNFQQGHFAGVSDLGHLCLETEKGQEIFLSGDIIYHD